MVEYKNILFCTDFSEDANIAFLHALNMAKTHRAKLYILHVPHSPFLYTKNVIDEDIPEGRSIDGQAFFDDGVANEAVEKLRKAYQDRMAGFGDYQFAVVCGAPDVEIIRYAKNNNIDLIVMGALGKAEHDQHGGTLASVSRYAHCHVMAIRNPLRQFTLPVKG